MPRTVALLGPALALALGGCPLEFQKEDRPNQTPETFFSAAPDSVVFVDEVSFRWLGSDRDTDVVAFQYQLVETDQQYFLSGGLQGEVLRSVAPASPSAEEQWSPRITERFETFRDLPDGWYEFRVRSVDGRGDEDVTPARTRFEVFFDNIFPTPEIRQAPASDCGRIPTSSSSAKFRFTATDASRRGIVPRSRLEYRVQLRAERSDCSHALDGFTAWSRFPDDDVDNLIVVGDQPPTQYSDLEPAGCRWTFRLQVRDPARQLSAVECLVNRPAP